MTKAIKRPQWRVCTLAGLAGFRGFCCLFGAGCTTAATGFPGGAATSAGVVAELKGLSELGAATILLSVIYIALSGSGRNSVRLKLHLLLHYSGKAHCFAIHCNTVPGRDERHATSDITPDSGDFHRGALANVGAGVFDARASRKASAVSRASRIVTSMSR
jgi:hypothetical protein